MVLVLENMWRNILVLLFIELLLNVLQNLRKKDSSMAGFAIFAKNYTTYKKNGPQYQQRVSYIKSLYEVHNLTCLIFSHSEMEHFTVMYSCRPRNGTLYLFDMILLL